MCRIFKDPGPDPNQKRPWTKNASTGDTNGRPSRLVVASDSSFIPVKRSTRSEAVNEPFFGDDGPQMIATPAPTGANQLLDAGNVVRRFEHGRTPTREVGQHPHAEDQYPPSKPYLRPTSMPRPNR